jgi:hypothetical protein
MDNGGRKRNQLFHDIGQLRLHKKITQDAAPHVKIAKITGASKINPDSPLLKKQRKSKTPLKKNYKVDSRTGTRWKGNKKYFERRGAILKARQKVDNMYDYKVKPPPKVGEGIKSRYPNLHIYDFRPHSKLNAANVFRYGAGSFYQENRKEMRASRARVMKEIKRFKPKKVATPSKPSTVPLKQLEKARNSIKNKFTNIKLKANARSPIRNVPFVPGIEKITNKVKKTVNQPKVLDTFTKSSNSVDKRIIKKRYVAAALMVGALGYGAKKYYDSRNNKPSIKNSRRSR